MHMQFSFSAYARVLKVVAFSGMAMSAFAGCGARIDDRISRVYALGRHPSEANKNRIEALIRDRDRDVRATAIVVMKDIDPDRARRMAAIALQDADGLVRASAVSLCGTDAETVRALAALAVSDPVWQVRSRALDAIASAEDPSLQETFTRALSDSVRHVRRSAIRAAIDHPGLIPADRLSDIVISDPDWENRVEAAGALGASKDPAAFVGLDAAVADQNEFVRAAASRQRRALETAGVAR
jgi:HEAT repeat protein